MKYSYANDVTAEVMRGRGGHAPPYKPPLGKKVVTTNIQTSHGISKRYVLVPVPKTR